MNISYLSPLVFYSMTHSSMFLSAGGISPYDTCVQTEQKGVNCFRKWSLHQSTITKLFDPLFSFEISHWTLGKMKMNVSNTSLEILCIMKHETHSLERNMNCRQWSHCGIWFKILSWSVKCNSVQFPFLTPVVKDSAVEMNMHRQIKTYYYLRYSIKEFSLPDWWLESSFATLTHVTNILLYEYTWWNVCAYLPWQLCG